MDEVDGNSRDTSTDGSSGSFSHILPEVQLSTNSEALGRRIHSCWSSPQLREIVNYGPRSREHNFSLSERTDVDRTNFYSDPMVTSAGGNQSENCCRTVVGQSEISRTRVPSHDGKINSNEASLTRFYAVGGEDPELPKTEIPLCRESGAELQSGVLFREDEFVLRNSGLHSGTYQPRRESSGSLVELRSDLNPWHENDLEQNKFLPKVQSELSPLSLRPYVQPTQPMYLREHLPKPHFTPPKETNAEQNARMLEQSACQLSMTGSFIQQCSDTNDFESFGQYFRDSYKPPGNSVPYEMLEGYIGNFGAGHLEHIIQNQDALLCARDQEILELKEANHKQSLFIEKMLSEKRILENAVVEQARLLMSHGLQRSNAEPVRQPVLSCGGAFDSQLYEAQLAAYREDFENERKEKLLIKGSADSLRDQLQTALNELRLAQEKAKRTEDELQRYKNPYRATYPPHLQNFSSHSSSTASSSTSAASAQSKTPLYRKPPQLETDRVSQTSLAMSSQMHDLSHVATGHEEKVGHSEPTRPDQPCWIKEAGSSRPSHLYQVKRSGTPKRPPGKENQINQNETINSGQINWIEQISLTSRGQQVLAC